MSNPRLLCMLFVCMAFTATYSYPYGPPIGVPGFEFYPLCETLFPYGHGVDALPGPAPFLIEASSTCFRAGQTLQVRVRRTDADATFFEGYLLQARLIDTAENKSYGQFSTGGNPYAMTHDCFGSSANAISHNTAKHYWYQIIEWTAPSTGLQNDIHFYGTVVHETDEFYLGVSSGRIRYDPNCADGQLSTLSFAQCDFGPCDGSGTTHTMSTAMYPMPSGANGQASSAAWGLVAALVMYMFCS
jgi:hypothetical protein